MDRIKAIFQEGISKVRQVAAPITHRFKQSDRRRKSIIISAGIGILVVLLVLLTAFSLPGNPLYALKVNVYEEAVLSTKPSAEGRLNYQITRLEHRLKELKRMSGKDSLSDRSAERMKAAITESADAFISDIEYAEDMPRRVALMHTNDLLAVLRAQERLVEDHDVFSAIEDDVEDSRRKADDIHENFVLLFISTAEEQEIQTYITEQLNRLLSMAGNGLLNQEIVDDVSRAVGRIQTALASGDGIEAITEINETLRYIEEQRYLGKV